MVVATPTTRILSKYICWGGSFFLVSFKTCLEDTLYYSTCNADEMVQWWEVWEKAISAGYDMFSTSGGKYQKMTPAKHKHG